MRALPRILVLLLFYIVFRKVFTIERFHDNTELDILISIIKLIIKTLIRNLNFGLFYLIRRNFDVGFNLVHL